MEWAKGWKDRAWLWLVQQDMEKRKEDSSFKTANRTRIIFMRLCELALKKSYTDGEYLAIPLSVSELQELLGYHRYVLTRAFRDLQSCGAITRVQPDDKSFPRKPALTIINYVDKE